MSNIKWNNLNNKLPEINKEVYITKKDFSCLFPAKLGIYNSSFSKGFANFEEDEVEEGQLYWNNDIFIDTGAYDYYWVEKEIILNLIKPDTRAIEIQNRAEILDIR